MAKVSSKWLSFLLAVMVVVAATGVNGQGGRSWQDEREHQGKGEGVFPPEGGRGGGGSWQDEREHEGKGEGVFPPEGGRGGGGGGGSYYPPAGGRGGGRRGPELREFILPMSKNVVETEAGVMRVVKGAQQNSVTDSEMHFGFITMEPNTMFIPQYLDSSIILFVERGTVRIGSIYNDKLVEKDLKAGDLYRIQGGSTFYLVNTAQGQRLHIIASIDTQGSTDWHSYEPFFIGGGTKPKSVLAGFNTQTIATALNVSYDVVDELFSSQQQGAIVRLNPDGESQKEPSKWKRFLEQGTRERKTHMQRIKPVHYEAEENSKWSFNNLFNSIFRNKKGSTDDDLEPYNIYGQEASFRNEYGWSLEVTGNDYKPLKYSDFGVYLVNLTAGSMMAPHVNPSAREFGIVLSGSGRIEVVYPNGTLAMDAEVNEGDMFWIPRYYPVCQMASRTSPFVIFGFTTSARKNMPQFLVGQGSVMQNMVSTEFAASFGMSEDQLAKIVNAQRLSTILPSASASPGGGEEIPETIESKIGMKKTSFAYNMAMELVD